MTLTFVVIGTYGKVSEECVFLLDRAMKLFSPQRSLTGSPALERMKIRTGGEITFAQLRDSFDQVLGFY